jgi:hypothetical protein
MLILKVILKIKKIYYFIYFLLKNILKKQSLFQNTKFVMKNEIFFYLKIYQNNKYFLF